MPSPHRRASRFIEELRADLDDAVRAFGLLSRSLDRQGVLLNQIAKRSTPAQPWMLKQARHSAHVSMSSFAHRGHWKRSLAR